MEEKLKEYNKILEWASGCSTDPTVSVFDILKINMEIMKVCECIKPIYEKYNKTEEPKGFKILGIMED